MAELEFRSLKDFGPGKYPEAGPRETQRYRGSANTIDLLYRLKDRWSLPTGQTGMDEPGCGTDRSGAGPSTNRARRRSLRPRKAGE